MRRPIRRHLPLLAIPASAQSWPAGPIRMVAGSGSQPDLMSRLLADALGPILGVPVVVENRVGVSGNLGAEAAFRAFTVKETARWGRVVLASGAPAE